MRVNTGLFKLHFKWFMVNNNNYKHNTSHFFYTSLIYCYTNHLAKHFVKFEKKKEKKRKILLYITVKK